MKFKDIPQFTRQASYAVDVSWDFLEKLIKTWSEGQRGGLQLNPDFQRGHIWDDSKRIAYVEYILRGGYAAKEIYFNHPNWMGSYNGDFVLVDGLQRITAIRKFLANEIPAFGCLYKNYEDRMNPMGVSIRFNVNTLKTRKEVLQWYLDLNSGGVVHTEDELNRVREMLKAEKE